MDERNDLFGDDDFNFDDNNFDFEDDELDFDDDDGGFDFEDDSSFEFADEDSMFDESDDDLVGEEEEGTGNRTFILIAAAMIIVFIAGLVAIILLASGEESVSAFDATSTFVAQVNATTFAEMNAANTEAAIQQATNEAIQATEFAQLTEAAFEQQAQQTQAALTEEARQTTEALNATASAVAIIARQTLDTEATQTADAAGLGVVTEEPGPTEEIGVTEVATREIPDVQLTATALAELFLSLTPDSDGNVAVATEVGTTTGTSTGGQGGAVVTRPGELPQTGLIDENIGVFALMAFGLMGIIFASRRLRSANNSV